MTRTAETVLADALTLDEQERAVIAAELLASLDGQADADAEAAWKHEIQRRVASLDFGALPTEPWEAALHRIEERLGER